MATLLTSIPAVCFPHEADRLEFSSDTEFSVTLNAGGQSVAFTLTPDSAGIVALEDFASLLRDLTQESGAGECSLSWDGGSATWLLLPCRVEPSETAIDFCGHRFLTLLDGEKPTHEAALEVLTFFNPDQQSVASAEATALWVDPQDGAATAIPCTLDYSFLPAARDKLVRLDVSPSKLKAPAGDGWRLHSYVVHAGQRSQGYVVRPTSDAEPTTLCFLNAFGQPETFHCFGTTERELKPTRSSAAFAGHTRNYLVEAVPSFTSQTGFMPPSVFGLFADLCAAKRAWLGAPMGDEICITDNDLKLSNDLYDAQTGSITWRYAAVVSPFAPAPTGGTFDRTFDQSFD